MARSSGISKKCYLQSGLLVFFSMVLFFVSPSFAGVLKIQTQTAAEEAYDESTSVFLFDIGGH
jgi:hypothetical protein